MKVIGQTQEGDMVLLSLKKDKGQIVDMNTGQVFRPTLLERLLQRFAWVPFKGDEEAVLKFAKEA